MRVGMWFSLLVCERGEKKCVLGARIFQYEGSPILLSLQLPLPIQPTCQSSYTLYDVWSSGGNVCIDAMWLVCMLIHAHDSCIRRQSSEGQIDTQLQDNEIRVEKKWTIEQTMVMDSTSDGLYDDTIIFYWLLNQLWLELNSCRARPFQGVKMGLFGGLAHCLRSRPHPSQWHQSSLF